MMLVGSSTSAVAIFYYFNMSMKVVGSFVNSGPTHHNSEFFVSYIKIYPSPSKIKGLTIYFGCLTFDTAQKKVYVKHKNLTLNFK